MADTKVRTLVWKRVRGRCGFDDPAELPDDMAAEALNVRLRRGALAEKRYGATSRTFTGDAFSGFNSLHNFVPGQNDAAAEFHFTSRDATPKIVRVAAGTAAANLTLADNIASLPQNARTAMLNGKLFWAYDSALNRLHVYDPAFSTTAVRRVGLATPAAPTAANTAVGGTYPAILRYYRVRWVRTTTGRRSLSDSTASVSFTPSGSFTGVVVTQPTVAGEGETHWRVEVSLDNVTFYDLSGDIAIGTTTYTDSTATTAYADGDASPELGAYMPPPSAKCILSTGDRLLMFGAYETTAGTGMAPYNGRVWWTPVLGTTDGDDDERVSDTIDVKGWLDISRDAGAEDRALVGPIDGQIFVFTSRGVYMLARTGNEERPFKRVVLSTILGAVTQESTFIGEDETGKPCIYFLDPGRGPYRYGAHGFQRIDYDVQDVWRTVNLAATNRVAHGVFNAEDRLVHWWVATGSSNDPDVGLTFAVREGTSTQVEGVRYGWVKDTGASCTGRCSVMFSETFGATMSRKRKPYVGLSASLLKTEDSSVTLDEATTFQSYVTSKAWNLEPMENNKAVVDAWLKARTQNGVTITGTLTRNYTDETPRTHTYLLTALNSEVRCIRRASDAKLSDLFTFQVTLGDASAVSNAWMLDALGVELQFSGEQRGNLL